MIAGRFVVEKARYLYQFGVQVDILASHHPRVACQETIDCVKIRRIRYMLPERWQILCYRAGITTNLRNSWFARFQLPFFRLCYKKFISYGVSAICSGLVIAKAPYVVIAC